VKTSLFSDVSQEIEMTETMTGAGCPTAKKPTPTLKQAAQHVERLEVRYRKQNDEMKQTKQALTEAKARLKIARAGTASS
jgi:hypothetical protein